jgi:hypothetical protein
MEKISCDEITTKAPVINAQHYDVAPGRHSQLRVFVEAPRSFNLNEKHREERIDIKRANGNVVAVVNWSLGEAIDRESVRGRIGLSGDRVDGSTFDVRDGQSAATPMLSENGLEKAWLRVDIIDRGCAIFVSALPLLWRADKAEDSSTRVQRELHQTLGCNSIRRAMRQREVAEPLRISSATGVLIGIMLPKAIHFTGCKPLQPAGRTGVEVDEGWREAQEPVLFRPPNRRPGRWRVFGIKFRTPAFKLEVCQQGRRLHLVERGCIAALRELGGREFTAGQVGMERQPSQTVAL